ncbi:MAG TPA: hypothetical protein VMA09_09050 [Candidatus Binataceae bacterium]|nr:hypothetical protein [Candidatus Binataceae bacterium]
METRKDSLGNERDLWFGVWVVLAIITTLAIWRLRDFPYHLSWIDAWHGMSEVLPTTLWATARIWFFWAASSAVLAGLILRIDPEIELLDAILGGVGGLWVLGYFLGVVLGPLGMFNTLTLWSMLALGVAWLCFHPPPLPPLRLSTGPKLALLATVLLALSMVPLQLASPVAPFMDVLAVPSSIQRIITFGVYLPFDNAAYGIWGPAAQTPGLELFLTMLGLGADLHEGAGALAQSQAMMPICALLIFACWRLGKTLFNDSAGGFAALLLFWTCLFRRAQGVRGTANDFALIGLAIAFLLDPSHRRSLIALGAMMLGTAVASHSLNGAFAMIVAAAGILFWLMEQDYRRFLVGIGCLAGATLIAVPDIVISTAHALPYLVLALAIVAGAALIAMSSELLPPTSPTGDPTALRVLNIALIALFILVLFARQSEERFSLFHKVAEDLPLLSLFCFAGLIAAIFVSWYGGDAPIPYAGLAAIALSLLFAGEYIDALAHMPQYQSTKMVMLWDVAIKLWDYWIPYFLVFPAGFVISLAYDRWSRPAVFFLVMTLLIYPWYQFDNPVDYDSVQHSITEQWAFNLHTAAIGYWAGHSDRRWTFGNDERPVIDMLQSEIAAGRITTATHILHLAHDTSSWSLLQFPILTGIDDDPMEFDHHPDNLYQMGGRVRGMDEFAAAIAARPPYILVQAAPPASAGNWTDGYDLIVESGYARLYRRHDLATSPVKRHRWRDHLVAIVALIAILLVVVRYRRPRPEV